MMRSLLRLLLLGIAKVLFRIRTVGLENVPKTGCVMLASNHVSYLDPPLIGCAVKRKVNFMAKEELFRNRFMRFLFCKVGAFPVRRNQIDRKALQAACERLSCGETLLIFPEGTISTSGELLPPKDGVGMIVAQTGAVVVPVFIYGSGSALPPGERLHCAKVRVYFGRPMDFSNSIKKTHGRELYANISAEIMEMIRDMKRKVENA